MTGGLRLSQRIAAMTPSATLGAKLAAERLRERGIEVIDFGPGEPDFNTPENVKGAAHRAIDANLSHYLPPLGLPALRRAVADSYRRRHGQTWEPEEVIVGCGAKSVLYLAAMALLSPGDEAIIPSPYWVSFPEQVVLAGATPVLLPTIEREGFVPRAERAAALVTPRTRAIILCSPSNPTGTIIPQDEVDRFATLAREKDLVLVYDETYEHFLYGGRKHTTPALSPSGVRERLLLVSSVSKTYAMTGYRVGYGVGPKALIGAMGALQTHDATHATAVAQAAAAEAIGGPQESVSMMLAEYARRRDVILGGLAGIPGVTCHEPEGAFYVYPGVAGLCARLGVKDSAELAKLLLEVHGVAVVAGEAFGTPGYIRLSYALSVERIREGIDRMRRLAG